MSSLWSGTAIRRAVVAFCALLIALPAGFAQTQADPLSGAPDTQQAAPLMSPEELNNLVAPIALYPDPLLSQVLAASTYPLEIVEAQQWLRQNSNLRGAQLMDAAKRQNWDPSVQAMVAFPDAFNLLANDIRWTTDLGNAFLAQQADVMSAVQRMRARARDNGRLNTTPQQEVRMETQNGQNAIEIVPADPQVIYVPTYNPVYVYGPPVWGTYPDLWYPAGFGWEFGFGPGIYMGALFPGWGGWGGWGWGCGWYGRGLFLDAGFFHRYGFRGGYYGGHGGWGGRGFGGRTAWAHDPGHRMGVPYPNRNVGNRFGGSRMNGSRFSGGSRTGGGWSNGSRSAASGGWQRFGNGTRSSYTGRSDARGFAQSPNSGTRLSNRGYAGSYRQSSPNYGGNGGSRSYRAPTQSYRGSGSTQGYRSSPSFGRSPSPSYSAPRGGGSYAPRSYSAPSHSYSAPRSFSAPRSSGGGSGFSGGRSGGSSGFSGGHSGGGGGSRSGGGGGGGHRR
jgi:hypothetical protein